MNRIHTTISAAILAMAGSVAFANEEAHKQQAADSQAAPMAEQQQAPQAQDLDTNAQRAHDRSGSKAGADAAANTDGSMGTATPGVQDLDTNAQRAHQPEGGAAAGADAGVEATGSSGEARGDAGADAGASASGGDASASASGETRDWAAIDADNDNLIGPDEMERALGATGAQAGDQQQPEQQQQQQPEQR